MNHIFSQVSDLYSLLYLADFSNVDTICSEISGHLIKLHLSISMENNMTDMFNLQPTGKWLLILLVIKKI